MNKIILISFLSISIVGCNKTNNNPTNTNTSTTTSSSVYSKSSIESILYTDSKWKREKMIETDHYFYTDVTHLDSSTNIFDTITYKPISNNGVIKQYVSISLGSTNTYPTYCKDDSLFNGTTNYKVVFISTSKIVLQRGDEPNNSKNTQKFRYYYNRIQ